jgi:hypothetical protein
LTRSLKRRETCYMGEEEYRCAANVC